jgi:Asp-tRNA(Asn)/Glu-tRNA(Gln) amidotransferase B subunit
MESGMAVADDVNYRSEAYILLGMLQRIAPTGRAQQQCADMYNEALKHTGDNKELAKIMANSLADGLNYGNWPWVE